MINIQDLGLAVALLISLHPLFHIITVKKYRCGNSKSLYLVDKYSCRLATSPWVIISCAALAFIGIFHSSALCILPLSLLAWKLFINDRFISLARGQGAPGYFCFLNTIVIFSLHLGNQNLAAGRLFGPLQAILLVEYGAIFLSAGTFKFLDYWNGNRMAFALGLLNPMWSKVYLFEKLVNRTSGFINFLGPSLQVLGGLFVISGVRCLMIAGYITIAAMFILITPQTRLGWLCPSIAAGAYVNYSLMHSYKDDLYGNIFFLLAVLVRLMVMRGLFIEYFFKVTPDSATRTALAIYRRTLGVIIWKVFTFDVVRIICSPNTSDRLFGDIYKKACKTNVYDSITLASLINSRSFIDSSDWDWRIQKALIAFSLNSMHWIKIINDESLDNEKLYPRFLNTRYYSYVVEDVYFNSLNFNRGLLSKSTLSSFNSYMRRV